MCISPIDRPQQLLVALRTFLILNLLIFARTVTKPVSDLQSSAPPPVGMLYLRERDFFSCRSPQFLGEWLTSGLFSGSPFPHTESYLVSLHSLLLSPKVVCGDLAGTGPRQFPSAVPKRSQTARSVWSRYGRSGSIDSRPLRQSVTQDCPS